MECPNCGYMLSSFDKECPRCANYRSRGLKPPTGLKIPADINPEPIAPEHPKTHKRFGPVGDAPNAAAESSASSAPQIVERIIVEKRGNTASVFWGIMLSALVFLIIIGIINAMNQQDQRDKAMNDICNQTTIGSGQSMDDCRAQLKNMGY